MPPPLDEEADAREHDAYMRGLDPALAAAAEWHSRVEDGLDAAEQDGFRHWLDADPAHARAYALLDRSDTDLRSLPIGQALRQRAPAAPSASMGSGADAAPGPGRGRAAGTRHSDPSPVSRPGASGARPGSAPSPGGVRGVWLRAGGLAVAAGATLALVAGLGWQLWQQPTFSQAYASARGQRLEATLPDGSALALDVATRTEVSLYRDRREVRLEAGQALFAVAADARKPFSVSAGPVRITALGTRFSVRRRDGGGVDVAVEEGRVRVSSGAEVSASAAPGPLTLLSAGQALRIEASGAAGEVTAVPVNSVALWRRGLLRFSNTPLAEAIGEMERYGPTGLVVSDPAVAALAIGGAYEIARPGDLAKVLPAILPVRLVPRSDGRYEVVRRR